MQRVFLSHSSKDKESYVRIVATRLIKDLGNENVILDELTFQQGRKTIEEIEKNLNTTDLFVFFISNTSLESKWVKQELFRAEELWNINRLQQICPIIIDESIQYDDKRIPKWLQQNYILQYISRPTKAAQIITQRMIELSFERHPRLKERNDIFVGRNMLINCFEERMDDFEKNKPICIVSSGIKSIGRTTLLKKCIFKSNIRKNTYPFPTMSLNYDESIEDFILKLYDFGLTDKIETDGLIVKSVEEKKDIAIDLIKNIQKQDEIIFIEDNGCIINHDGELSEWFIDILSNETLKFKITICLISKFRLIYYGNNILHSTKEKIFSLEVDELSKKERDGLLSRYLDFENVDLSLNDKHLISGLLAGYPEQVFYTVTLLKEKGMDYLNKHTEEIVEFNNKKASILLKDIEKDEEKKAFLALLSAFDYIGMKFIYDIVDDEQKYIQYINEFVSNAICEYVGVMKEYIRVNETIKDYVVRNNFQISENYKLRLKQNLNIFLKNLKMDEYDIPEFLFSLKEALIQNKDIDDKYLVPSLYLKTMNDFYNKRKNKEVITFADKALEKEAYMDERMIFEIRYLLCSALAKLKDKRFLDEVHKIKGADFDFLFGFYYRQIGKYDSALEKINRSMQERPNFSKAKREKVQIYISMQEFQSAKDLARENYLNYKENPYHIQAYFACLIKSERSRDNRIMLETLLSSLSTINSDVSKEMYLRCSAQFEAFYNDSLEKSLSNINKAIFLNPNIQYARLVKFDICDKFNLLSEMEEILNFFKQPEFRNKYLNNIVCFTAILMAKSGRVEEAVEYYKENIKNYTEEAKDKFVIRLNKYQSQSDEYIYIQ